jgi:4-azaleucine resistance transporter AzlC
VSAEQPATPRAAADDAAAAVSGDAFLAADESPRARFRQGLRDGLPFAIAGLLVSASFGVVAHDAGFSPLASIVMSAIVFAGSAQFAAVAILTSGGTASAAIGAAALMNSRFLPMGAALGPSLPGGALKRALQGQAVVDSSWAMSARGDGTFDRWQLFGATAIQYVTWSTGTAIGALAGDAIADPDALGLDAVYPTFFLALLVSEIRSGRALGVAALGAAIALALVPFAPGGVPVLVASLAALLGLTPGARAELALRRRDPRLGAGEAAAEEHAPG